MFTAACGTADPSLEGGASAANDFGTGALLFPTARK
jgi:hypothetical protein